MIYFSYFLISIFFTYLTILVSHKYSIFIDCHQSDKPQRFHNAPIPRAGGLSIFLASIFELYLFGSYLIVGAFFIFFSGILEDYTGVVSQKARLAIQTVGALIFVLVGNMYIHTVGLGFQLPYILGIAVTVFAMVGVVNAINIIDGLNGLASGVSLSAFAVFAYFCFSLGDMELFYLCAVLISSTLGFFVFNFPRARVFLGDGGAYIIGFMLASVAILIVNRHTGVSAWFCLSVVIYPVWEVIYSIIRRTRTHGAKATAADKMHLHQLVMRRLRLKNHEASALLVLSFLPFQIAGFVYNDKGFVLFGVIAIFIFFYQFVYYRLTKKIKKHTKGVK